MKNEHNREELWGGRETAKYPVTLPVDVLLNPIHFAWSLSFNVQNIHICWPGAFQLHLLVGLILNVPQGDRQSKMKKSLFCLSFPDLPCLMPIPSLAGREAQHGEVSERRVLAPGSSLAHCHSGHVLLPAWTSDISATKWGLWVRGFQGGFLAALKCHLWLWLTRG